MFVCVCSYCILIQSSREPEVQNAAFYQQSESILASPRNFKGLLALGCGFTVRVRVRGLGPGA